MFHAGKSDDYTGQMKLGMFKIQLPSGLKSGACISCYQSFDTCCGCNDYAEGVMPNPQEAVCGTSKRCMGQGTLGQRPWLLNSCHGYHKLQNLMAVMVMQVGVEEALHFQETQELPEGFVEAMDEGDEEPTHLPMTMASAGGPSKARRSAPHKAQPKGKLSSAGRGKTGKKTTEARLAELLGPQDSPASKQKLIKQRQARILQSLALAAPSESPFANRVCLDGIQALVGVL